MTMRGKGINFQVLNAFMGGDYRKALTDTPVSGETGPFHCIYYSDSAACRPPGLPWGEQYGQKL